MKFKLIAMILMISFLPAVAFSEKSELIIPKGTTLACYSEEDIKAVAERLYNSINTDTEQSQNIRRAYEQGEYLGSLILYRKLVIDKLRRSTMAMDGSLLRYYYSWDVYYLWADVMIGDMTFEEKKGEKGTTKDVLHMLDFPDMDQPSHVLWLPCEGHEPLLAGGALDLMSVTNLANRTAHTGDFRYVKKIYQYLEDFADNLPMQNIEHFGWGDTPLLQRSFTKANVTLEKHAAAGYFIDYYYALAPQDIGARKLSYILQKSNQEQWIFYAMAISAKALPRKDSEHTYGMEYPRTLLETSFTDELADEAYDLIDPVRLTKTMLFMLEYSLPVLGETLASYEGIPSANIGVSAYGALARMAALLTEFDSAKDYADKLLPRMNDLFTGTQFKDGGFMESHFNYNEGEAANKRALYQSIIGIVPEFIKYLTVDLDDETDNWDLLVEGYSGILLPNVGNYSNYGTSDIWNKVPQMEITQGKKLQDYTSVYYPYSGFAAQRDSWLYDGFHLAALTKSQRYSGHGFAQTNAVLNLQAYGRQLILNGGMPFYGKNYVVNCPEFLENGYDEINSYMSERSTKKASTVMVNGKSQTVAYYEFDDNGVLKDGQSERGKFEPAFNQKIYDARWLSNDDFDFAEGCYNNGWTVWDYDKEDTGDSFADISNLPMDQAITKDATHNREFIFVKDANLWIVLDKLTNTHNESNEYSCMWHFPAWGEGDWRLSGFKNEEIEIDEAKNLVYTNSESGPNLYLYNFSNEDLSYEKYFGFWEKGNREAYGWSLGGNMPELGNKYLPRPEVHVKWSDTNKGDITRLVTVLAPSKDTENPIVSQKNVSNEDYTGFKLETADGVKITFYSGEKVRAYEKGDIHVNAKEVVFVENGGETKILALDSVYADKNNVSLNYMLGDNFTISLDKNGAVNNVRNFGVPETFAWKGDKKQDGAHIPIYTYAELEKEYVPTTRIQDVYDHWSRYYVLKLEEEKVLEGMEQFEPDIPVTKECFVNWLVKASNAEIHEYNGCFADVRPDDSNADYIQTAYDLGFIHGDNGNFYPGHNLSREEMAEIMNNILKYKGVETMSLKKSFQDIDQVSDWAKAAVENCLAAGILSGNEAFEFNPQNTFSRAEAATVTAKTFCGAY